MNFKSILACAALLIGIGTATAAVESDVVGYTTITMEAGKWYMVGTPFVALDDATAKLNNVFTIGFGEGDTLQLYKDGQGYSTYRWNKYKNGWATSTFSVASLADVVLPAGQAVFINKRIDGEVVLSGKVAVEEAVTFGSEAGNAWDQFVCVYPETVKLNSITWTGMAEGDTLQIYNPGDEVAGVAAGYVTYRWNKYKNGWATSTFSVAPLAEVNVPAGQAFFVNKKSAGKATCVR